MSTSAYQFGYRFGLAFDAGLSKEGLATIQSNASTKQAARALMSKYDPIYRQMGGSRGVEAKEDEHKQAVARIAPGSVPQAVVDELENENYHTLVEALTQLGKVK